MHFVFGRCAGNSANWDGGVLSYILAGRTRKVAESTPSLKEALIRLNFRDVV
jgi:hypothetical protein